MIGTYPASFSAGILATPNPVGITGVFPSAHTSLTRHALIAQDDADVEPLELLARDLDGPARLHLAGRREARRVLMDRLTASPPASDGPHAGPAVPSMRMAGPADATARLTGTPGVAAVTAGPGLTNTITALKNAQLAQSPVVLIGGAAPTALERERQLTQEFRELEAIHAAIAMQVQQAIQQRNESLQRRLETSRQRLAECHPDLQQIGRAHV